MKKNFSVKITKPGVFYVILTILIGAAAVNTGNSILYLIVSLMLSIMALCGISSFLNLTGLDVKLILPEEIYANRKYPFKLKVKNKKILPSFFIECGFDKESSSHLYFIPRKNEVEIVVWKIFKNRGFQYIDIIFYSSFFPMDFFSRTYIIKSNQKILVYPEPIRWIYVSKNLRDIGKKNILFESYKEEFKELREYRYGDSIKLIHWLTSARFKKLMVKEYEHKEDTEVILKIPNDVENIEEIVKKFTYACNYLMKMGFAVGLKTPHVNIDPARDENTRKKILTHLALYEN